MGRGNRTTHIRTSLGLLLDGWMVSRADDTVDAVAAELAAVTEDYARPYLDRLEADPETSSTR